MTKEEAIRLIKDHIDTYVVCHGEEDTVAVSIDNVDVEAFDMAIKALEQQPCEDAVSRQALLDHEEPMYDNYDNYEYAVKSSYIKDLPSVQPKSSTSVLEEIRTKISKGWYVHPTNRYEEGKKDGALWAMQIVDEYLKGKEGAEK